MAELILLAFLAAFLLLALPQLLAWGVARLSDYRGSWLLLFVGIAAAPLTFYLLATLLYAPGGASILQGATAEGGGLEVLDPSLGTQIHAGLAALLQIVRIVRSRTS